MNNNVMTFNLIVLKIFPNFVIQKEGEREKKGIDPEGGWKESWRRKKGAVCVSAWVVCDRSGARGWTVVDRKQGEGGEERGDGFGGGERGRGAVRSDETDEDGG